MKVTYVFGAGASAGPNATTKTGIKDSSGKFIHDSVIPVVQSFNKKLIQFLNELSHGSGPARTGLFSTGSLSGTRDKFKELSVRFVADLELHHSVDTLARKYFVKYGPKSQELVFLKFCVAAFLIHRQYKHGVDPRYDLFFAAIGNRKSEDTGGIEIPNDVSIVSWNYDSQIELSLTGFTNYYEYPDVKKQIQGHPWLKDAGKNYPKEINSGFNFLKLNGSADLFVTNDECIDDEDIAKNAISLPQGIDFKEEQMLSNYQKSSVFVLREKLLYQFKMMLEKPELNRSLLSFSWEVDSHLNGARERLNHVANQTEILVVIGYSFPTFNRKMDRQLARNFNQKKLKRIYVQVHPNDFDSVGSRLKALFPAQWNIEVEYVKQLDEFYVPYELDDETMHKPQPIKMKF